MTSAACEDGNEERSQGEKKKTKMRRKMKKVLGEKRQIKNETVNSPPVVGDALNGLMADDPTKTNAYPSFFSSSSFFI